jgi:hypothetical protein
MLHLGGRKEILQELDSGLAVVDVSVTHPLALGPSYNRLEPNGYQFVCLSIESYGQLAMPVIPLLGQFGMQAATGVHM